MTHYNQDPAHERFLDRLGIPHVLRWGFLGLLIFMTGNGTESNFIAPHMQAVLGSPEATVATIITVYGASVLVGSYLAGALSDLWGPRRVMLIGAALWVTFEILFLLSLAAHSLPLVAITYFIRGFGYPLFAFGAIPAFGGGTAGETGAMWASIGLVIIGFLLAYLGVRDPRGGIRIAPVGESAAQVLTSGIRLTGRNPKILMGFLVRLINTAPQYGMFIILPTVIAKDLHWGQARWLTMTVFVYATNILVNAVFGAVGDAWGWVRTVRWFGVFGSSLGLLAWWYVPHLVPAGSTWGFWVSVVAGCAFGCLLAGFVPLGAILPALAPDHKGAAMAMYTTAAGGAAFLGAAVVAVVLAMGLGNAGVVWGFVVLFAASFVMTNFLHVPGDEKGQRHH